MELLYVFLIAATGYAVGRIKIRGIETGTAGVLLTAMLFGHFGVQVPEFINGLGIALFVTSVGFIAGPKFFRNLKANAASYILVGFAVVVSGTIVTIIIIIISGIPAPLATGLFAGALTSTPGLAAATEAAGDFNSGLVSVGYGIAYPFGVVGVVVFVQIIPRILKADMEKEREKFHALGADTIKTYSKKLISCDPMGMMPFCAAVVAGILLGRITIPLPGNAKFALGVAGGPLIAGLIFGHFSHIWRFSLQVKKSVLEVFRELGLVLFLIAAGTTGGRGFADVLREHGGMLFVYGAIITAIPLLFGYIFSAKVLKMNLFSNLGSICGGITSTPALGTLINVTKTSDIATAYAATYPIALVLVVLSAQFITVIFSA